MQHSARLLLARPYSSSVRAAAAASLAPTEAGVGNEPAAHELAWPHSHASVLHFELQYRCRPQLEQ